MKCVFIDSMETMKVVHSALRARGERFFVGDTLMFKNVRKEEWRGWHGGS
jgi:hypothetical protein